MGRAALGWQLALLAVTSALCLSRLLLTRYGLELLALAVVSLQLLAAGAAWRLPPARWRQLPQALLFALASEPDRTLVKRVAALSYQGEEIYYQLLGDNPAQSQDSRHFGEQPHSRLQGRVVRVLGRR